MNTTNKLNLHRFFIEIDRECFTNGLNFFFNKIVFQKVVGFLGKKKMLFISHLLFY